MKKPIAIDKIMIDKRLQMRVGPIDEEHVDDLVEGYERKDEIEAPRVWEIKGRPNYFLTWGFHRIAALEKLDRTRVECEVKSGDWKDAVLDAIRSNIGHGKRRSSKDKRRAVETALDQFPEWPDRQIAEEAGVSHTLVAEVKKDVADSAKGGKKTKEKPSNCEVLLKALNKVIHSPFDAQTADHWLAEVIKIATEITQDMKKPEGLF